jgi:hypothetical protein
MRVGAQEYILTCKCSFLVFDLYDALRNPILVIRYIFLIARIVI